MHRDPTSDRETGIVLISVLWVIALISLLVSALNTSARTSANIGSAEAFVSSLESASDAAVEHAVARLSSDGPDRWVADGRSYTFSFGQVALSVSVQHAAGLIDLNTTRPELLNALLPGLLRNAKRARALSSFIMTKREEAKAAERSTVSFFNDSRVNAPDEKIPLAFRDVSALLDGSILTAREHRILKPFLTVFSGIQDIDTVHAPKPILMSLAASALDRQSTFEELSRREKEKSEPGTAQATTALDDDIIGEAYHITIKASATGMRQALTSSVVITKGVGQRPYRSLTWQPYRFE